jgi:hypothetical protein
VLLPALDITNQDTVQGCHKIRKVTVDIIIEPELHARVGSKRCESTILPEVDEVPRGDLINGV